MSKWTHILSLWLGSEISSALQNRSQRKQFQHDDYVDLMNREMDLIEELSEADDQARAYQEQIEELNDEIARLRLYVADLECELDDLRDEYDC